VENARKMGEIIDYYMNNNGRLKGGSRLNNRNERIIVPHVFYACIPD
jgi:hypothetical protein